MHESSLNAVLNKKKKYGSFQKESSTSITRYVTHENVKAKIKQLPK